MQKLLVPVEDLVPGLYVVELDQPWLDTPFLFQGFPIHGDKEIRELRHHCSYVYVDPLRSDSAALARLPPVAAIYRLPPRSRREIHRDLQDAFGADPYPGEQRFRELVKLAGNVRSRSRRLLDRVLEDARLGHSVDTGEMRKVVSEMVEAVVENASASLWLTNLKKHDEYTSIHCLNVCVLAVAFGRHLGLSRATLEVLGLGALLHDIGKMRTPDAVLNKPGPLTPDEFDIMRRHPEDGYQIMKVTGNIPVRALEIIRFHHERLSGRGYPLGLRDGQISLPIMITALADVYDAMTSDRVYRRGMPADQVLKILFQVASTDFGQELVEEFIRCLGIFPVGSLVELSTGALGVVIGSSRDARMRPVVLLVRTPDGARYEKRLVVNLAALAEAEDEPTWAVRRVADAEACGIDVPAILAAEMQQD